ncbi:uncharacterized protein LOC23687557 [Aedes aegypti]|uniref:Uncharacterized protein n=1 Tax=Aedes aegypti TaxID=7159 RepID=A0A903V6Z5_AEDAE|nr:uncharacterized protein LOC23687557 [Aedes aegypti]
MTDQQRYPVAERNRRAKMRFLEGMKTFYEAKRKTSVESLQSESAKSTASVPKIDLSVPGTPISSRYLRLRRESESSGVEVPPEPVVLPNEIVVSSLVIDKFLKDMKALGGDEKDGQEQHAEVVNLDGDSSDEETKKEGDVAEQYFKESEEKHTYHRTFSEAVQTLHSSEVKSPVVKRYLEESSAKHSYARDFNEAVNELNPAVLEDDPLKDEPIPITKGYKSSVPGTPISSKHLDKFKKRNYISDSSDDEDEGDTTDNRYQSSLADPLDKFIKEMEELKAGRPDLSKTSQRRDNQFSVDEYLNASETKKSYARTFSEAAQTLYSTEVKDPNIKDYFEQSDAKKTFRREFSEVYQEIKREEPPLQPEQPVVVEEFDQKKVPTNDAVPYDSLEELFGTFEPPKIEPKPISNDFSVNSYMTASEASKSYARSFSQAVQTLHATDAKDPSVREYLDQSLAKNAFRRGFSEVYREVDVKDIARDIIPSKPQSSDQQKDNKQSENPISRSNDADADGSPPAVQKPLPQKSISVPGTPINSRKLNPREKPPRSVEAKPERDGPVTKSGSQSEMSATEHAENSASAVVRGRAVSTAENNMDKAFWMSFGSS